MADSLTLVDLFSGAGGISAGFHWYDEGRTYDILAGIDIDSHAVTTFLANHPSVHDSFATSTDARELKGDSIKRRLGLKEIDVVVGGPPCQGFSHAGPRDPFDKRNELVWHFVRLVGELAPSFFLMENVPGLLKSKRPLEDPTIEQLLGKFREHGYDQLKVFYLNAVMFGVPQNRKRVFILGNTLGLEIPDIIEVHHKKSEALNKFQYSSPVTVKEAIFDLPSPSREQTQNYASAPQSKYQELMRKGSSGVFNHIPASHKPEFAQRLKEQKLGTRLYNSWNHSWYKLDPDKPSPTVKENHRAPFVHPREPRVVTPRECARLQSFRDKFIFHGTKSSMLVHIGNAVPPLLAMVFADIIARKAKGKNAEISSQILELV